MKTTQLMSILALAAVTIAHGETAVLAAPAKEGGIIISGSASSSGPGSSSSSSTSTTTEDGKVSISSTFSGNGEGKVVIIGPDGKEITAVAGEPADLALPLRWAFRSGDDDDVAILRKAAGPVTFLGISTAPVTEELAPHLSLPPDTGLVVEVVAPGSPAEQAGLQRNDILARLDDQILIQPRQLSVLVANHKEGDKVKLVLIRQGKETEVSATLSKKEHATPAEVKGILGEAAAPLRTFTRRFEVHPGQNGAPEIQELSGPVIEHLKAMEIEHLRKAKEAVLEAHGRTEKASDSNAAVEKQLEDLRNRLDELTRTLKQTEQKK